MFKEHISCALVDDVNTISIVVSRFSFLSLKLSRPEILIFFFLLMDPFPSLGSLKDPLLVKSKSVCLLTSEEDVDAKTDFAWLELPVRSGPGPFELCSTLFQLGWKVEKHAPVGISMNFEIPSSPCWMCPASKKRNKEVGGKLKVQRGLCLVSPYTAECFKKSVVLVSIRLSPSYTTTENLFLDSKPKLPEYPKHSTVAISTTQSNLFQ